MVEGPSDKRALGQWRKALFAAVAMASLVAGSPAGRAQSYDRPPADIGDQGGAQAGDATAQVLRIDRLESEVRDLNGQVQQLQFNVKRLQDALQKFQMDVDSRLQPNGRGGRPQKRTEAPQAEPTDIAPARAAQAGPVAAPAPAVADAAPIGSVEQRHDAFNPALNPGAPGDPLPLGSPDSASKPLDIMPPSLRNQAAAPAPAHAAAVTAALQPNPAPASPSASLSPVQSPDADFRAAEDKLRARDYGGAQQGFAAFLQKYPHSPLAPEAIYHLGDSFYYRGRHREAAEQYLKIASRYSKSSVAPNAMVKLGVSLNALGAKEQACEFFSEMPRKYPHAPKADKQAAAREAKKASC